MTTPPRHTVPIALPALATILAALAMIGPFTIDTYLPSFPHIGAEFSATPAQLQQTLSLYLFTLAFMTLCVEFVLQNTLIGRRKNDGR